MGSLCFHTGKVETAVNSTICGLVPELRPTPDLRQLPDPFYANDVTVWNLAPALPFARYARHVLVTVLHQLLRDHNVSANASEYITVLRSAVVRFQGLAFDSIAETSDAMVRHKASWGKGARSLANALGPRSFAYALAAASLRRTSSGSRCR